MTNKPCKENKIRKKCIHIIKYKKGPHNMDNDYMKKYIKNYLIKIIISVIMFINGILVLILKK